MKKIIALVLVTCCLTTGCQSAARQFGGDITMDLEPNQKLEMITWKGDDLWYLTRPMRADETAETHVFNQSSEFGIVEGSVTVIEHREETK